MIGPVGGALASAIDDPDVQIEQPAKVDRDDEDEQKNRNDECELDERLAATADLRGATDERSLVRWRTQVRK